MNSIRNLVDTFVKVRRADRFLPHAYNGTYEVFERLYLRTRDPWGLQYSPFNMQRYLTLLEIISQMAPCSTILDVGCGEGAFTIKKMKPALRDLKLDRLNVVHAGDVTFPLAPRVRAVALVRLLVDLKSDRRP